MQMCNVTCTPVSCTKVRRALHPSTTYTSTPLLFTMLKKQHTTSCSDTVLTLDINPEVQNHPIWTYFFGILGSLSLYSSPKPGTGKFFLMKSTDRRICAFHDIFYTLFYTSCYVYPLETIPTL